MSSLPLRGRLALVTGVGGVDGIGFAVAQALARDGARVAITSTTDRAHQRAGELTAQGAEAVGWVRDLTDRAGVRSLLDEIHTRLGRVEVLVNNAGMTQTGGAEASALFHELAPEQWDRQIAITLTSAFNVTRELVNDLIGHGWGRIVTVSSVTGPLVSYPGQSAYAAAKAGLEGLTRSLAVELGQYGITVNSVAPGWIETGSVPVSERRSGEFTPVGRPGRPEEVAAAVSFLARPEAAYITGQSLVVDGGNTIQEDHAPKRQEQAGSCRQRQRSGAHLPPAADGG
jgi:3-oxoacyl-[acyl-carrier protein] reductase